MLQQVCKTQKQGGRRMFTKTNFKKLLLGVLAIVMVVSQTTPVYEAYAASKPTKIVATGTPSAKFTNPFGIAYVENTNTIYTGVTNTAKDNSKKIRIYKYKVENDKYTLEKWKELPHTFDHPNDMTTDGEYLYIVDCTKKFINTL